MTSLPSTDGAGSIAPRLSSLLLGTALALPAAVSAEGEREITLTFAGEFGGQPFDCGTRVDGIGASGANVAVADYRLYVSRVRLLDADGGETPLTLDNDGRWQTEDVALLDFEDATGNCTNGTAATNDAVRGHAPAGDYTGVAFDVGVPFESNHGDPTLAASPLNLTAMFWNWRGGYRFLRVDLAGVRGGGETDRDSAAATAQPMDHGVEGTDRDMAKRDAAKHDGASHGGMSNAGTAAHDGGAHGSGHGSGWALHVGSTGCTSPSPTTAPDACAAPNRIEVVIEGFDPVTGTLVVDPAAALERVDVAGNTPDTAPGCMSSPDDPECGPVLDALGLGTGGSTQVLVRAR